MIRSKTIVQQIPLLKSKQKIQKLVRTNKFQEASRLHAKLVSENASSLSIASDILQRLNPSSQEYLKCALNYETLMLGSKTAIAVPLSSRLEFTIDTIERLQTSNDKQSHLYAQKLLSSIVSQVKDLISTDSSYALLYRRYLVCVVTNFMHDGDTRNAHSIVILKDSRLTDEENDVFKLLGTKTIVDHSKKIYQDALSLAVNQMDRLHTLSDEFLEIALLPLIQSILQSGLYKNKDVISLYHQITEFITLKKISHERKEKLFLDIDVSYLIFLSSRLEITNPVTPTPFQPSEISLIWKEAFKLYAKYIQKRTYTLFNWHSITYSPTGMILCERLLHIHALATLWNPVRYPLTGLIHTFHTWCADGFQPTPKTFVSLMTASAFHALPSDITQCTEPIVLPFSEQHHLVQKLTPRVYKSRNANTSVLMEWGNQCGLDTEEMWILMFFAQMSQFSLRTCEKEFLNRYTHSEASLAAILKRLIELGECEEIGSRCLHAKFLGIRLEKILWTVFLEGSKNENIARWCLDQGRYLMNRHSEWGFLCGWGLVLCAARLDNWAIAYSLLEDMRHRNIVFDKRWVDYGIKQAGTIKLMIQEFKVQEYSFHVY